MGLGSVHPALACHSSGSDSNNGLQGMESGAERIGARIQKREYALALVVIERIPNDGQRNKHSRNQQQ